jgi:hypothetical protein
MQRAVARPSPFPLRATLFNNLQYLSHGKCSTMECLAVELAISEHHPKDQRAKAHAVVAPHFRHRIVTRSKVPDRQDRAPVSAVEALVSRVFPPGCEIVPVRSVPEAQRFVVIPGRDGPRWIAPIAWDHSEKVLRQWSPINPLSRGKWHAVMLAHRLGCIDRIPGTTTIGIANLDYSYWHRMGLTRSAGVIPIVYVARPSTTQKAVVSLLSLESRKVDCVVKVALGSLAWPSIERDYSNLQRVEQLCPGLAPRPIGLFRQREMSSQEWIAGEICLRPSEQSTHDFLTMLWQPNRTTLRDLAQRFHRRFDALPPRDSGSQFERMFDSIQCDDQVPSAFYHGDFVSWNLISQSNGARRAIDWEFGDGDGAPLLDLFHFFLRFPLAAGTLNSYQAAARFTLGVHGGLVNSILDRLGASYSYAENALTLSFIALYLSRFDQICAVERIQPQLCAVAATFAPLQSAAARRAH